MLRLSLILTMFLAPDPQTYQISNRDTAEIQFRMLDGVNALREARGAAPVRLNSELTAAAKTHSRDMSVQNRPWHFGSDGSSPTAPARSTGSPALATTAA